jgi:hypothetical protein
MAITDKRIITGTGVGDVGTGTGKLWPTAGNPTFANSGLYFTFAEGAGLFERTGAATGTFRPWGAGPDAKPSWASGPSFVELPANHPSGTVYNGQCVAFLANNDVKLLHNNSTDGSTQAELDFEAGYLITCGIQWWCDESAFSWLAGSESPVHNPGALSFHAYQNSNADTRYQCRMNAYNVGGFRPSLVLSNGGYVTDETVLAGTGGFSSANPNGHLEPNRWHKFQAWVRRSTTAGGTDGEIRVYLGGRLVMRSTGVNVFPTGTFAYLESFFGLLAGFTAARAGYRFRYCCPIRVQVVPEADLPLAVPEEWDENTTRGMDVRRLWPVRTVVDRATVTALNGGTPPTSGRMVNTGGTYPGRSELIIRGTSGQRFLVEFPPVWAADVGNRPFGAKGWMHVNFESVVPDGGKITCRLMDADGVSELGKLLLDDTGTGTVKVNDVTVLAGRAQFPDKRRWQPVFHLRPGELRVTLHDLSDDTGLATMCRTFTTTTSYSAEDEIGKPTIELEIGAGNSPMKTGKAGVWANASALLGDSYGSSNTTEYYAVSGVNQGTKTVTVANMGTRVPTAGDRVYWALSNSGVNDGTYTVASATATTITFVEAIPNASATGSINLVWPQYHVAAQRLGVYLAQGGDCDGIPNGYDPAPFGMTGLAGFNVLLNLARSGKALERDLTYVLPGCVDLPLDTCVIQGYTVNSTTATATESAMNAQAIAVAGNQRLLIEALLARGARVIKGDSPNLQDAGTVVNGAANRWRRITPRQVDEALVAQLPEIAADDGRLFWVATLSRIDANGVTLSDGIHIDAATALRMGYTLHAVLAASKLIPGRNADGSIRRSRRGGGFRSVLPSAS